jgi:hypothetical protein
MAGKLSLHVLASFLGLLEFIHQLLSLGLLYLRFVILVLQLLADGHAAG